MSEEMKNEEVKPEAIQSAAPEAPAKKVFLAQHMTQALGLVEDALAKDARTLIVVAVHKDGSVQSFHAGQYADFVLVGELVKHFGVQNIVGMKKPTADDLLARIRAGAAKAAEKAAEVPAKEQPNGEAARA